MKSKLPVFSVFGLIVLISGACTNITPQSRWTTLLDGESGLENFHIIGEANWHAMDGSIMATQSPSGSSFLVSKNPYRNFRMRVEIWSSHDGNSGVFIRCDGQGDISSQSCYEVNIYDQREDPTYGTGAIVRVAPVDPMPKAGGKWNTLEITANGTHLQVILNGSPTVDVMDSTHRSGVFGLQWGSGIIKFRKLEIMTL